MVQFGELCNIQCIMCPQDHLSPVGISPESIERVKEAIPSIANMTLTGGEPTAFKQCWEIIEHFNLYASKQARIGILTNLKSVSKQRVERYFNNINYLGLGINVDAAKKATYEHIRRGANWEQFNRNLADLLEYRAANDKKNWHFNLTMTIMKSNLHEIVDCIKWAGSLGLGFGCGPMTGDYGPVKNARTYLEENIFRYPHIGVSQAEAISVFEQALEAADCIPLEYREGAKNNISGMIEFAKSTKPVVISEPDVEKLRALPDAELSQALCSIVTTGTAPWNLKPPKAAWWMKRARNARNIIRAAVRQA
jgi:MoaA/NifB/PqqE/SkfB family radical SAM enzyme